jgi:hypothetical protein
VFFLWVKGLNAKEIHEEMFPVYDGKCLSRKASSQLGREIATLVANVSLTMKMLKCRCRSG